MARLSVLTYAKREALETLGAYEATNTPDYAVGAPICHNCGTEIEATSDEIAEQNTAPIQTLFCWDGDALLCCACVLKYRDREVNIAMGHHNVALAQMGVATREIARMTGMKAKEVIAHYDASPVKTLKF